MLQRSEKIVAEASSAVRLGEMAGDAFVSQPAYELDLFGISWGLRMSGVWSTVGVFLLGGVGWVVTSLVGGPFRQFFNLRGEVIHKSVLYANVRAAKEQSADRTKAIELTDYQAKRLHEAEETFRDLAARMRAFALNERLAVWLVKRWGYDPMKASSSLLAVEDTLRKFGRDRHDAKEALESVLRFRTTA